MADANFDLLFEILRKIQADQADLKKDNREVKETLSRIERQVHSLRGDVQELRGDFIQHRQAFAVMEGRIEHIETRLDLRDA